MRVRAKSGVAEYVWAGFAKKESLNWWKSKGAELVDLPAEKFAERSDISRRLVWDVLPDGTVIRAIIDLQSKEPLIKIVTRAATEEELKQFEHPRMPLFEHAIYKDSFNILEIPHLQHPADLF